MNITDCKLVQKVGDIAILQIEVSSGDAVVREMFSVEKVHRDIVAYRISAAIRRAALGLAEKTGTSRRNFSLSNVGGFDVLCNRLKPMISGLCA